MAKLKFEPYIERASTQSLNAKLWRTYKCGDEYRHFAEGKLSRPQSGYNINRVQVVPPAGGGEPRDTKVLSGEPID